MAGGFRNYHPDGSRLDARLRLFMPAWLTPVLMKAVRGIFPAGLPRPPRFAHLSNSLDFPGLGMKIAQKNEQQTSDV